MCQHLEDLWSANSEMGNSAAVSLPKELHGKFIHEINVAYSVY
jgi:antitoxin component of MazEF toxin-antitoxin module